jgi:ActR/RegA family two-component response regulator
MNNTVGAMRLRIIELQELEQAGRFDTDTFLSETLAALRGLAEQTLKMPDQVTHLLSQQGTTVNINEVILLELERFTIPDTVSLDLNLQSDIPDLSLFNFDIVVQNLIQNALDAMPAGGSLSISTSSVAPQRLPTGYVELIVSDTGTGIAREVLPKIFELNFSTKHAKGQGLGLGLWWIRNFVRRAKGDITVSSSMNEGSEFVVKIPFGASSVNYILSLPKGWRTLALIENLLIVEDDAEWCNAYKRAAEKEGFRLIKAAKDLAEAETFVDEIQFALAFIDIGLNVKDDQNVDGLRVMQKIRESGDETSIVVVTGRAGRDVLPITRDSLIKYGAHDIVGKAEIEPKDIRAILKTGREAFRHRISTALPAAHNALRGKLEPWEWDDQMLRTLHVTDGVRGLYRFLDQLAGEFLPLIPRNTEDPLVIESGMADASYWSRSVGQAVVLFYAEAERAAPVIEAARSQGTLLGRYQVDAVLVEKSGNGLGGAVFAQRNTTRQSFGQS